jgi:polysaccharide biosynthesis transport protein
VDPVFDLDAYAGVDCRDLAAPKLLPGNYHHLGGPTEDTPKLREHDGDVNPAERLNTLSQEVLSETRLQAVIDELQLYLGLRGSLSREEIIATMRRDIKVQVKEGSAAALSAFTITYTSKDRSVVAVVANKLASSFIEKNLRSREQRPELATTSLHLSFVRRRVSVRDLRWWSRGAYRLSYGSVSHGAKL